MKEFSKGYYRTDLYVRAYDNGPVIQDELYNYIDRELYAQTNAPVTMRVGLDQGPYFVVESEHVMPSDVLALPNRWIDDMKIKEDELESIFVLKPEHAYILNQSVKLSERFDDHNLNSDNNG